MDVRARPEITPVFEALHCVVIAPIEYHGIQQQ